MSSDLTQGPGSQTVARAIEGDWKYNKHFPLTHHAHAHKKHAHKPTHTFREHRFCLLLHWPHESPDGSWWTPGTEPIRRRLPFISLSLWRLALISINLLMLVKRIPKTEGFIWKKHWIYSIGAMAKTPADRATAVPIDHAVASTSIRADKKNKNIIQGVHSMRRGPEPISSTCGATG